MWQIHCVTRAQTHAPVIAYQVISLVAQSVTSLPAIQETWVRTLSQGRSPEGNGNPLQYSCLENSMDRGAWWPKFHGVAKSQAWLSYWLFHNIQIGKIRGHNYNTSTNFHKLCVTGTQIMKQKLTSTPWSPPASSRLFPITTFWE